MGGVRQRLERRTPHVGGARGPRCSACGCTYIWLWLPTSHPCACTGKACHMYYLHMSTARKCFARAVKVAAWSSCRSIAGMHRGRRCDAGGLAAGARALRRAAWMHACMTGVCDARNLRAACGRVHDAAAPFPLHAPGRSSLPVAPLAAPVSRPGGWGQPAPKLLCESRPHR